MKCQHDTLARGTTILIEGHWAAGVRARCTTCNLSVAITKHGKPKLDSESHVGHPDAKPFADGTMGCPSCGARVTDKDRLHHEKDCQLQFGSTADASDVTPR
jgi:hypothetical protein